jgi:hypothetical protein
MMRKLGDVMRDLLHERDGALADERDRHRVGANSVVRDAARRGRPSRERIAQVRWLFSSTCLLGERAASRTARPQPLGSGHRICRGVAGSLSRGRTGAWSSDGTVIKDRRDGRAIQRSFETADRQGIHRDCSYLVDFAGSSLADRRRHRLGSRDTSRSRDNPEQRDLRRRVYT